MVALTLPTRLMRAFVASAETHTWHLFAVTPNVVADIDLGVQVEEGKWYSVETDFDATSGTLHGLITDKVTGAILTDTMAFLHDPKYGAYDPSVDGVFNAEAYFDSEISLLHSSDPIIDAARACRDRQYQLGKSASRHCL